MGLDKEAKVTARLDGVQDVVGGAAKVNQAWSEAGTAISKSFKSVGGAVGEAVSGIVSDLGHVVTVAGSISFAQALQSAHQFEETTTRMGVGSKRSIDSVQDSINTLSTQINELPNATADWISAVGKLTYSYEGAAQAAKGAQEFAAFTGQSFAEVAGLTVALQQTGGATLNVGKTLGVIVTQAQALGTVGGPKALSDMFQHLQGQLSNLNGESGLGKTTALLAGFGAGVKGFTPQQRERALGSVMSKVEGSADLVERALGIKITDENGLITDMTGVQKKIQEYGQRGAGQRHRLALAFGGGVQGRQAVAAIMNTDFEAIQAQEKAAASTQPGKALEALESTPAGQRRAAEIAKAKALQDQMGSRGVLGSISDWIGQQSGQNPITTAIGLQVGTRLAGKGLAAGTKALFGGGAAAGGEGAAAAGAAGAAGAGEAGAGTALASGGAATTLAPVAAGLAVAGGTLMALHEMGKAAAVKQGLATVPLGVKQAGGLAAQAAEAEAKREANMSPGMKAAMEAEKLRGQAPIGPAMVAEMTKAGAAFKEAVALLSAMMHSKIVITDNTSLGVETKVRGEQ